MVFARYLLQNLDDECAYISYILRLFERHKSSPRPNTITLIKVIAVISGKHSEHETEMSCFVICTALEPLRHRKLHCTPWSI